MDYYGWIPILTSQILFEEIIYNLKLKKNSTLDTEKNIYKIHTQKKNKDLYMLDDNYINKFFSDENLNRIKNKLSSNETHEIFCFLKIFDDIKNNQYAQIVAVLINKNSKAIEKILITSDKESGLEIYTTVNFIRANGLISFNSRISNVDFIKNAIKQSFIVIRDIYHEHTYSIHTDYCLTPVEAISENDAMLKIYKQFQNKILKYHKEIRLQITILINEMPSDDDLKEVNNYTHHVKGEMLYALNFIKLFSLSKNEFDEITLAIQSFDNLLDEIKSLYEFKVCRLNKKLFIISNLIVFFYIFPLGFSVGWFKESGLFFQTICLFLLSIIGVLIFFFSNNLIYNLSIDKDKNFKKNVH